MEEHTFTIAEAKRLLPQLQERLLAVKQEKEVLVRSHGEIKRASAKAECNGGSVAGPRYIRALERISDSVEAIQEMGIRELGFGTSADGTSWTMVVQSRRDAAYCARLGVKAYREARETSAVS